MAKQKTPGKKPQNIDPDDNQDPETPEGDEGDGDDDDGDDEDANKRVNAIVTNRLKREMKALQGNLAKQIADEIAKAVAGLSKQTPPTEEDEDEEDQAQAAAAAKKTAAENKRLTRMEKELADERAARQKAEKERADELERNRRSEMRSQFERALQEYGVSDPRLMRAALDQLEQDGYMVRDESDKIRFKGKDKYDMETLYDPKAGLKGWIQTEGKSFIPAVDAGGSGSGGARNQGQGSGSGLNKSAYAKLSDVEKARIELDRASRGLPPLE